MVTHSVEIWKEAANAIETLHESQIKCEYPGNCL